MIGTKIDFSNSQSTITGITLFPYEELFILALYFTQPSTANLHTYVFFCFLKLFWSFL